MTMKRFFLSYKVSSEVDLRYLKGEAALLCLALHVFRQRLLLDFHDFDKSVVMRYY